MKIMILPKLLRALINVRQHEQWTRSQIEAYQTKRLLDLRKYAYERSPFYQTFHRGLMDSPLQDLPVLTKSLMMENFDSFVTDRTLHLENIRTFAAQGTAGQRYQNRYWVNATSGSSGQPGFFLFNEDEWATILASFARGQEWSGVPITLIHRQRMAVVASISPWHMSSQVSATVQSWWRPSLRIPASQPLVKTVDQLNAWQPDVLVSYASMAGILAEEQLAKRLQIHPKVVYVASEILTPGVKQLVKEAWGDEPFNQYAATETAGIASEHSGCRHLHFYEDLVIPEIVDERYRPVPPGEYGAKILVTTLFSRTQPLIRYELSDSVRALGKNHTCGLPFTVLESVEGRVEDSLTLPAHAGGDILIRPLVINTIMDIAPVSGWQIQQQSDRGLLVLLAGMRGGMTDEMLVERITHSLTQEGARVPYVQIKHVAEVPKTAAGKAPLIKAYKAS